MNVISFCAFVLLTGCYDQFCLFIVNLHTLAYACVNPQGKGDSHSFTVGRVAISSTTLDISVERSQAD